MQELWEQFIEEFQEEILLMELLEQFLHKINKNLKGKRRNFSIGQTLREISDRALKAGMSEKARRFPK